MLCCERSSASLRRSVEQFLGGNEVAPLGPTPPHRARRPLLLSTGISQHNYKLMWMKHKLIDDARAPCSGTNQQKAQRSASTYHRVAGLYTDPCGIHYTNTNIRLMTLRLILRSMTHFFHLRTSRAAGGLLARFLRQGARPPRPQQPALPIRSRGAAHAHARPRRRNL